MAASGAYQGPPIAETQALVKRWAGWFRDASDQVLGNGLIALREAGIDAFEVVFAEGLRRFDKSGEYGGRFGAGPGGLAALEVQALRGDRRRAGHDQPPAGWVLTRPVAAQARSA
jgi:hypothetical protein